MTTETANVTVTANGNGNVVSTKSATATTTTTIVNSNGTIVAAAAGGGEKNTENQKKNRIQVSNTKKPLFFYVNLAKRYIQQHNEVELSALGMAITTVVTIAEILKNNGLATEKSVITSTVGMKDETRGKLVQKAKIEIVLGKTEKFDSLVTNNNAPATVPTTDQAAAAETEKGEKESEKGENKK